MMLFKRKNVFIVLILTIVILVVVACVTLYLLDNTKNEIRVSDFSSSAFYINIFDGTTGRKIMVYDEKNVKYIISNLSNPIYKRTGRKSITDGFLYSVSIFDDQDNLLWKGTINGEDCVVIGKNVYSTDKKIDINYINNLLKSSG